MKRLNKAKSIVNLTLATLLLAGCTFKEEVQKSSERSDSDSSYISNKPSKETSRESDIDSSSSIDEQPISESAKYIDYVLSDDGTYYSAYVKDENKDKMEGNVTIPSEHSGKPVKCILPGGFSNCTKILSINVPDSVTKISCGSFYRCFGIREIYIGSNVKDVDFFPCDQDADGFTYERHGAFAGCHSLERIIVSPKNKTFFSYEGALYQRFERSSDIKLPMASSYGYDDDVLNKGGVTLITIPFQKKNLTIPENVTFIHRSVFYGASLLENIEVSPDNQDYSAHDGFLLSKSGQTLYYYYKDNKSCVIPDSVKFIEYAAFAYSSIESVSMSDNVLSVKEGAFLFCKSLCSVKLSDSLDRISESVFMAVLH